MATKKKVGNSAETTEETPVKQSIEEVVEEAAVLKAEAEIEDAETQKKQDEDASIPEVEVDLDEEREKTKKEALETVNKEIVEPLKKEIEDLKNTLAPEEKDPYDEYVEKYKQEHGEVPEWKILASFLEERAVDRIKAEQKTAEDAKVKADEETAKAAEEQNTKNFQIWQGQLQDMEDKGMLPKMEKAEAGDSGFDARVKLYGFMQATWKTGTPSTNLWEINAKFGDRLSEGQPAGADAPVSMSQSGGASDDTKEYGYNEIHQGAQDLEGFILKELQKAGNS